MKKSLLFIFLFVSLFSYSETAIKLNGLFALAGMINPAVEVGVHKNATIQLEYFGSYYHDFANTGIPIVASIGFLEGRYYPKKQFDGFFAAPTIGYGSFKLQKWDYWGTANVQYGSGVFLGASIGYVWQVKQWLFELTVGGGWQYSIYEGYNNETGERYDVGTYSGKYNISAEWIPFKGGLMIGYRF